MTISSDKACDRTLVSSLMDEAPPSPRLDAVLQAMQAPDARDCWHTYQIIGDVLRAPELAACCADADFAARLSQRLQHEPREPADAPFLPTPPVMERDAANDGVFRWKLVAGLASFMAVAAMGWGLWSGLGPDAAQQQWAGSGGQAQAVAEATPATPPQPQLAPAPQLAANGPVLIIRDPELDQFLQAHGQASGLSTLSGGFLRNATFEGTGR